MYRDGVHRQAKISNRISGPRMDALLGPPTTIQMGIVIASVVAIAMFLIAQAAATKAKYSYTATDRVLAL